ncbi:MAG: Gfo/Idh/MocA family oxidoreductase [Anaerolinea sp.]|nr:Gfo/Idh/MocA family oxidoreductase [Anaerolinea sp.]
MTSKIRWGILSTAKINEALIFAMRSAPRSELVAVASRTPEAAQAYAAQNAIPIAYGSYEELLADPNIDVIYNPLPNKLHAEWTVKAAQAGKHVLLEKPLVTTMSDFDAIAAAAQAHNVVVFEAFMALHAPQNRKVAALIQQGRIGKLHLINSWFSYYLPPENVGNIRLHPDLDGGAFWDVGVYPNSLSITVTGGRAPQQVWAVRDVGETGVDVGMSAQLRFDGGAVAQIYAGFRAPSVHGAQFIGTDGMIRIQEPWFPGMRNRTTHGDPTTIQITNRDGSEENIVVPATNAWQMEVEAMEACLLDGAPPVVPLSLSREFLRSALAVYESARTGKPVDLT